jgi:hypothetical protein
VIDAGPPSDDSGEPPDADATADAGGCGWNGNYESPACSTCLRSLCCVQTAACEDDPQCVALDQCVDACLTGDAGGDGGSISTCAQACADSQSQAVRNEWQGLNNCIEFQCSNSGAGPCQ